MLTPDHAGTWYYVASFRSGNLVALNPSALAGQPVSFDGANGSVYVECTDPDVGSSVNIMFDTAPKALVAGGFKIPGKNVFKIICKYSQTQSAQVNVTAWFTGHPNFKHIMINTIDDERMQGPARGHGSSSLGLPRVHRLQERGQLGKRDGTGAALGQRRGPVRGDVPHGGRHRREGRLASLQPLGLERLRRQGGELCVVDLPEVGRFRRALPVKDAIRLRAVH